MAKTRRQQDGCLVWTGSKINVNSVRNHAWVYGNFYMGRQMGVRLAHRMSYEHFVGPIPEKMYLDHLCRNTLCVEPSHLEPVTNRENQLRGLRCVNHG